MTEAGQDQRYNLGQTLGPKRTLWAAFTPSGLETWQMALRSEGRGKSQFTTLLQTTAGCPLATVTVGGETFPLPIGWHERVRGGGLRLGGERKIGGGILNWDMRWTPDPACPASFVVALRVRATPRRTGTLHLTLRVPLHAPDMWTLAAAALRGHCAQSVYSAYSAQSVLFCAEGNDAGWDAKTSQFTLSVPRGSMGGGKAVRFRVAFVPALTETTPRAALVSQYATLLGDAAHPLTTLPDFHPAPAAEWLADPAHYAAPGAERLYLSLPGTESDTVWAGAPHFPLDALKALSDWNHFHPRPETPRLVRRGASGIAADFAVMGTGTDTQPNKGAFWDKRVGDTFTDAHGNATHGIAANARMARSLFLLHDATGEKLLRQSALNICQWLLLKTNADGWYDGAHVHATLGLSSDGRVIPKSCALDGAEAIRPFVLAFRATRSEVFIKAAWKIATGLLGRMAEFDAAPPTAVVSVLRALLALDAEAPNVRLREAIISWGAWLRTLLLRPDSLTADGGYSGLYDCAGAGFALFTFTRDPAFLRYAFHSLSLVPPASQAQAWRAVDAHQSALLSVAALLPESAVDFDRQTVTLGWRVYAPDPATEKYIHVRGAGGELVHFLPLVCRASDQLLLLALAAPHVETLTVLKNGRRPVVRDLLSGALDTETPLRLLADQTWARVGLFTIDP